MSRIIGNGLAIAVVIIFLIWNMRKSGKAKAAAGRSCYMALLYALLSSMILDSIGYALGAAEFAGKETGMTVIVSLCCLIDTAIPMLFALSLLYYYGWNCKISRNPWLWALPMAAELSLLIWNGVAGTLFTVNMVTAESVPGKFYPLLLVPAIFYVEALVIVIYRNIRYMLLIILAIVSLIFLTILNGGNNVLSVPIATLMGLIAFSVGKGNKALRYQMGAILFTLFLIAIPVIENFVVSSQLQTALLAEKSKNDNLIRNLETNLQDFFTRPIGIWFLKYWEKHPDLFLEGSRYQDTEESGRLERIKAEYLGSEDYYTGFNMLDLTDMSVLEAMPQDAQNYTAWQLLGVLEIFMLTDSSTSMQGSVCLIQIREDESAWKLIERKKKTDEEEEICADGLVERVSADELEARKRNFDDATRGSLLNWSLLRYGKHDKFAWREEVAQVPSCGTLYLWVTLESIDAIDSLGGGFELATLLFLMLIALLILAAMEYLVVKPVQRLQSSVLSYRQDKDGAETRESLALVKSENEIGALAGQFSEMTVEMDHYMKESIRAAEAAEHERTELKLAASIQRDALSVAFPKLPEMTLFASMTPAKNVGGDFYDFFMIDDRHLVLVIADVSGKGIPAALFMMSVKTILNNRALGGGTPAEILRDVNHMVAQKNKANMFVTVWLGILDTASGEMICTSAGHEFPFLRGADGTFSVFRDPHGMMLGIMDGVQYQDYRFRLSPGEAIFVYTDGIPEARNPKKDFYGLSRLGKTLNSVSPEAGPEEISEAVSESVRSFSEGEETFDDLTMLCLVYHGPAGASPDSEAAGCAKEK